MARIWKCYTCPDTGQCSGGKALWKSIHSAPVLQRLYLVKLTQRDVPNFLSAAFLHLVCTRAKPAHNDLPFLFLYGVSASVQAKMHKSVWLRNGEMEKGRVRFG